MKRVTFYTDHEWAFGSIHLELCKYLFSKHIDAQLLPWSAHYTIEEMAELDVINDVYVTTPTGYNVLVRDYRIDPGKIVVVVHGIIDFYDVIDTHGQAEFDQPKVFAVVSEFLRAKARELGITREPIVLPLGINTNRYHVPPATMLRTVGYAAAFRRVDGHTGYDLKRGYLVEQCAKAAGLEFKVAQTYHHSYATMPGFYESVDCVITASTEEGGGLPALEAGAAGRLVISTNVGHWPQKIGKAGGHEMPMDEAAFLSETTKLLTYYRNNPAAFAKKCRSIQKHAASYDWSHCIDHWIAAITS